MSGILLTKDSTPVIGWIAVVLGQIMEWIFDLLNLIGIPNIGLAIIIFTIVVYSLMLPLTIKQQKFSKLSNKMNPELQAIQAYDVWQEKKLYGKVSMGVVRTTYIIDEQGNIEKVMPKVKPDTNAAEILDYLAEK